MCVFEGFSQKQILGVMHATTKEPILYSQRSRFESVHQNLVCLERKGNVRFLMGLSVAGAWPHRARPCGSDPGTCKRICVPLKNENDANGKHGHTEAPVCWLTMKARRAEILTAFAFIHSINAWTFSCLARAPNSFDVFFCAPDHPDHHDTPVLTFSSKIIFHL